MDGAGKPAYWRIRVPVLALYAVPRSARDVPPWLRTNDESRLQAIGEAFAYGAAARERAFKAVRRAPNSRIVVLHGADHYLFLSNPDDVVNRLREFMTRLLQIGPARPAGLN